MKKKKCPTPNPRSVSPPADRDQSTPHRPDLLLCLAGGGSLGSRLCNGIRVREDYWGALLGTAPGRREGSETGQRDEWNRPVVSAPFAQGP